MKRLFILFLFLTVVRLWQPPANFVLASVSLLVLGSRGWTPHRGQERASVSQSFVSLSDPDFSRKFGRGTTFSRPWKGDFYLGMGRESILLFSLSKIEALISNHIYILVNSLFKGGGDLFPLFFFS